MGREGRMFKGVLSLMLVLVVGLAAACTSDEDGSDNADSPDETAIERADRPSADESAPDPMPVDIDDLETIEEWQAAGVPRFGDGDVLDFEPHASVIENGGTLLLAGDDASAEEIIGFYRGALSVLDWEERWVSANELSARSQNASILITVTEFEDQTNILMILTDSPR